MKQLFIAFLIVLASPLCLAGGTIGSANTEIVAGKASGKSGRANVREYFSTDRGDVGRLMYYGLPRSAYIDTGEHHGSGNPVSFNGYPSSPSPYSSPLAFVVVNEKASFRIVLKGSGRGGRWAFAFENVETGDYRFCLLGIEKVSEWYTMAVEYGDSTVGEVMLKGRTLIGME